MYRYEHFHRCHAYDKYIFFCACVLYTFLSEIMQNMFKQKLKQITIYHRQIMIYNVFKSTKIVVLCFRHSKGALQNLKET